MPFWAIFKNYTEIVRELGHRGHRVDVLKMDIEGYEFQALSQLGEATPNLPLQVSDMSLTMLASLMRHQRHGMLR